MAEVIVFHHALGLTDPLRRFAAALRDAGHTVHWYRPCLNVR